MTLRLTAEEIAWADAHGIDLNEWFRAEHAAGVHIAATLIDRARRRRLRALDRAIVRRGDALSELHASGLRAAERTAAERREHRVSVARAEDGTGWQPVCSCGWVGRPAAPRRLADQDAWLERVRMFRMLSEVFEHSASASRREVA